MNHIQSFETAESDALLKILSPEALDKNSSRLGEVDKSCNAASSDAVDAAIRDVDAEKTIAANISIGCDDDYDLF